jgi:hypothetical protein
MTCDFETAWLNKSHNTGQTEFALKGVAPEVTHKSPSSVSVQLESIVSLHKDK